MWLKERGGPDKELFEIFAGGGIVSLTAVFENLVGSVTMVELNEGVAAVWQVITEGDAQWLADKIITFELTPESAQRNRTRRSIDQTISFCHHCQKPSQSWRHPGR